MQKAYRHVQEDARKAEVESMIAGKIIYDEDRDEYLDASLNGRPAVTVKPIKSGNIMNPKDKMEKVVFKNTGNESQSNRGREPERVKVELDRDDSLETYLREGSQVFEGWESKEESSASEGEGAGGDDLHRYRDELRGGFNGTEYYLHGYADNMGRHFEMKRTTECG